MKAMTLSIAVVMAATGCETAQQKEARGLVLTPYGDWVPKGTPYFGDGVPMKMPDGGPVPIAFDPTVFNQAMAPAAPPIIIAPSAGTGVTMASQVGGTTVVTQFGGNRTPIYAPPIVPIDTSGTPIYYTESIQQP